MFGEVVWLWRRANGESERGSMKPDTAAWHQTPASTQYVLSLKFDQPWGPTKDITNAKPKIIAGDLWEAMNKGVIFVQVSQVIVSRMLYVSYIFAVCMAFGVSVA